MNKVEITSKHNKPIIKESNKAKELYDFVSEHSFKMLTDEIFEDKVVEAFKSIKENNTKLYQKYQTKIDGIIDVSKAMDYQDSLNNDEFATEIFEILTTNIEDFLNYHDDLADEIMKELSSFNIGFKYIGNDYAEEKDK